MSTQNPALYTVTVSERGVPTDANLFRNLAEMSISAFMKVHIW